MCPHLAGYSLGCINLSIELLVPSFLLQVECMLVDLFEDPSVTSTTAPGAAAEDVMTTIDHNQRDRGGTHVAGPRPLPQNDHSRKKKTYIKIWDFFCSKYDLTRESLKMCFFSGDTKSAKSMQNYETCSQGHHVCVRGYEGTRTLTNPTCPRRLSSLGVWLTHHSMLLAAAPNQQHRLNRCGSDT